jgi:anti-sigma factor RsiW
MNGHIDRWLEPYLDGELTLSQKQQVESHLARCSDCRERLSQAQSLSSLLREAPPATELKTERQFVAEIGLQLDRRPDRGPHPLPIGQLAWLLIPVGSCLIFVFFQTQFVMGLLIQFVPGLKEITLSQTAFLPVLPFSLPGPVSGLVALIGIFNLFDWNWLTSLIGLGCISLLYLGWLASWWARNQIDRSTIANS